MQFANNNLTNQRVFIDDAKKGEEYLCPICGNRVILRLGSSRAHHFAHKESCTDRWNYDMSQWHIDWQDRFPKENREVVIGSGANIHRADVCIGNTVIEFQHSHISKDEFYERNAFYTYLGYKVIWLFDLEELYGDKITQYRENLFDWKYASKTFKDFDFKQKVHLYFQFSSQDDNNKKQICRVISAFDDFSSFSTFNNGWFSIEEFINLLSNEEKYPVINNKIGGKIMRLFPERDIRNDIIYRGCCCNSDHIVYQIDDVDGRMHCDRCPNYMGSELNDSFYPTLLCHVPDSIIEQASEVLCYSPPEDEYPGSLEYITINGDIVKMILKISTNEAVGKSLFELWNEYKPFIMRCLNIRNGMVFQISSDPQKMARYNHGCIQGKRCYRNTNKCSDLTEIYYANRKIWVMAWFKKPSH